jgi:hypothetical protein
MTKKIFPNTPFPKTIFPRKGFLGKKTLLLEHQCFAQKELAPRASILISKFSQFRV